MPRTVRVTEQDLRGAMRDERYWRSGHPERAAFVGWVTDGFRGLYPPDGAARGAVWVRAYVRNGQPVAAHWTNFGDDKAPIAQPSVFYKTIILS